VRRLVTEELCTVVYNFRNKHRYVVAPSRAALEALDDGDDRKALLSFDEFSNVVLMDGENDADHKRSTWWGEINVRCDQGLDLYERLKDVRGVWLVVDLHQEMWMDERPRCRVALFSSMRSDKFKGLLGGGGGEVVSLFMPPWDLDEAVQCAAGLSEELGLSQDDVERRFAMFGGSARSLFRTERASWTDVDFALRKVGVSTLADALNPQGTDPTLSSVLVHATVSDDYKQIVGKRFASEAIRDRLFERLASSTAFTEGVWLGATEGMDIVGSRAFYFEQLWHYWAQHGAGRSATVKFLGGGCNGKGMATVSGGKNDFKTVLSMEPMQNTVRIINVDDLKTLSVGQYVKPSKTNFPAVDAFATHVGPLWAAPSSSSSSSSAATPAAKQRITVVLWQMTISKDNKHSAKAEVLASILAKCKRLLQQPFDVVFLYAVEDISGFKFQPYVKQKGDSYEKMPSEMIKGLKDIKQYAIKFQVQP